MRLLSSVPNHSGGGKEPSRFHHLGFSHYRDWNSRSPIIQAANRAKEIRENCLQDNKIWAWIALSRETREVVAYACGDRSEETCQILWNRIPFAYKKAIVFTDYWKAYQAVIPNEQHNPVGKETGETAHVERWNTTLRQHLARFVRKTLSFSKCVKMHEICLKLFLHRYNTELLSATG